MVNVIKVEMVPTRACVYYTLLVLSVSLQALAGKETSPGPEYDVVVVGLGAAGMAALTRLTERGYKVLGLEAKDRIGGRVNTQEFGGGLVEFGAEWIHGEDQPTYALARDSNVPIVDTPWHRPEHWANNGAYNQTLIRELFELCMSPTDADKAQPTNDTLGDFVTRKISGDESQPTYGLARAANAPILDQPWSYHWANVAGENWAHNSQYNQTFLKDMFDHIMDVSETEQTAGLNETLGNFITRVFYKYIEDKPAVALNKDFCTNFLRAVELALAGLDAYDSWQDESVRGAQDYQQCNGSQGWSWHRLGYRTLFDILLKKYDNGPGLPVDIRLTNEVTEIDWSQSDRVLVKAESEGITTVYEGAKALVTVSLGVLKLKHATWFKPSLPKEKVEAIEALSLGTVDKICLYYEQPWWGNHSAYFFLWTDEELSHLPESDRWVSHISSLTVPMSNPHVITLWITGAAARHMETLDVQVVKNKTEELLRRFFKDVPSANDMRRSSWFSDPHVRGSYSFHGLATDQFPPGAPTAALAAPLPGEAPRLFFAGEASNQHHFSTVHGALETGFREADRINAILEKGRPPAAEPFRIVLRKNGS